MTEEEARSIDGVKFRYSAETGLSGERGGARERERV